LEGLMPGIGNIFVAVALFFFAFTTILAYYYIAETNVSYINRFVSRPWMSTALKFAVISAVVYGTVNTAELAWSLGDTGVGLMAWLNIVAIFLLSKTAFKCLEDYEAQKAKGIDPVFHPTALGIDNAQYWQDRLEAQESIE